MSFIAFNQHTSSQKSLHIVNCLASFFVSLIFIYFIYRLFQTYDWGHSFTKFLCFSGLFALILMLFKHRHQQDDIGNILLITECLLALAGLAFILVRMIPVYGEFIFVPPTVDIGYTTEHAAKQFFLFGQNPYLSQDINVRPELAPKHRGFHYGPGMLLGYAPAAFFPDIGYKAMSLLYFIIASISLSMLVFNNIKKKGCWQVISTILITLVLFLLPERLWYEVFKVGANDIYPVALLLLGIVCVQKEQWLFAGILIGLSIASKFSPAAFLLIMFLRKDIQRNFFIGCVLGIMPLIVFLAWDYHAIMANVFILRMSLEFDSTSLYSITPDTLHVLFPLVQFCAVLYFIVRNVNRTLYSEEILVCFTLLLIVIEVSFQEMHANHLIWFYPFIAFIVGTHRHRLFLTKGFVS